MTGSGPPAAPRRPPAGDGPGADPYAWMRDRDRPEMREYLAAERAWYDGQTAPQHGLREELFAEMAARLPPAGESPRWRQGGSWYFTRTVAGQQLEQFCRAAGPDGPGEVLLDENLLLSGPGLHRQLRGAGRPRDQPGRAVPGLLGGLRRRRGVPAEGP